MKKTIQIEGMSCQHCVMRVKQALMEVEGVKNAEVSLDEKTATVETADTTQDESLKAAISTAGYTPVAIA